MKYIYIYLQSPKTTSSSVKILEKKFLDEMILIVYYKIWREHARFKLDPPHCSGVNISCCSATDIHRFISLFSQTKCIYSIRINIETLMLIFESELPQDIDKIKQYNKYRMPFISVSELKLTQASNADCLHFNISIRCGNWLRHQGEIR